MTRISLAQSFLRPARSVPACLLLSLLPLSTSAQDNSAASCTANFESAEFQCENSTQQQPLEPISDHSLDWADRRQVPEELQDRQCLNCDGRYMDPLADVDRSIPPEVSDIVATAGSTEIKGNTVRLSGGVYVQQGYRHLSGDSAVLDREQRAGEVDGNITLREPGLLLRGEHAEVFSRSGEARVDQTQFVLHQQQLRGTATTLRRDTAGVLHIEEGKLSFCAPEDEDWALRADEIELDIAEGVGTARGTRIDLGGVPVFYFPWMRFPIDDRRRTGFLWPDVGSDTRGGVDISVPVYFNLAPNYDALYAPRFIQERGLNHELKMGYLGKHIGAWQFGGAYLKDDERYQDDYPEEDDHDRWLAVVQHKGLFDQRWRSEVDYSKASDVNYMKDLETSSLDSKRRTALLQLGSMDYLGEDWLLNLDVQQFQNLADDIREDYKKLPQFTAQYRQDGEPFRIDPILTAQYSNFDTDSNRVTGERLYVEAGATYPMQWTYGYVSPTAKYRALEYDLNRDENFIDSTPSAGSAMANVDGGLFFDRETSFQGKPFIHTLEPRFYYLYSEYEDQTDQPDFDSAELTFTYNQLFRETRFSGRDRLDDANQLSLGISSRFIDAEDGREELSASIGQIFYFRDREVRLNPLDQPLETGGSEIAAEVNFRPNRRLGLTTSLIWDPYTGDMNSGNFLTTYKEDDGSLYNLGYSYRRPLTLVTEEVPTEQAHFSTFFPMGRNWSLFAGINYSLEAHTSVEDMVGVEYDTCCWKVRLLHLRYYDTVPGQNPDFDNPELQREHSTQVQIVLKGMGGFGSRATSIMEDMIRGFEEREN